jgi:GntR family transcriptional regulator, transcriptional repressor for pyruvate dehydrogenase complex
VTDRALKDVDTAALRVAPRESLSTRSATILKRYLLSERLEPGDRLPPERRLAEALNVSRTVLREAINQLVGEGIIHREPSRSPRVADFDRARLAQEMSMLDDRNAEIRDLIQLRVILELGAIEAIVERATAADIEEMERWVVEAERRLETGEPLSGPEVRFHSALLNTLGNSAVNDLLPLIEENMRENLVVDPHELTGVITDHDRRSIAEHRQIFEAVKTGNADEARRVMLAHLDPYLHPERYRSDGKRSRKTAARS